MSHETAPTNTQSYDSSGQHMTREKRLEQAIDQWDGDPRSALGALVIGRASSDGGAFVLPPDVNMSYANVQE